MNRPSSTCAVFFNDTAPPEIYPLSLHDALPISSRNIFDDPQPIALERPVLMTSRKGIPACSSVKSIHVRLNAIELPRLRTLTSLDQKLEFAAPSILATLCHAISSALSNLRSIDAPAVSHMPHVHQWTTAAAPSLGLTTEQINSAVAADPLIGAVQTLLESSHEWTGTATELARILDVAITPQHLSEQLNALPLALFGLTFASWMGHRQRRIRLAQTREVAVSKAAA